MNYKLLVIAATTFLTFSFQPTVDAKTCLSGNCRTAVTRGEVQAMINAALAPVPSSSSPLPTVTVARACALGPTDPAAAPSTYFVFEDSIRISAVMTNAGGGSGFDIDCTLTADPILTVYTQSNGSAVNTATDPGEGVVIPTLTVSNDGVVVTAAALDNWSGFVGDTSVVPGYAAGLNSHWLSCVVTTNPGGAAYGNMVVPVPYCS